MNKETSMFDKLFMYAVYFLMLFLAVITIYPFWSMLILSLKPRAEALTGGWNLMTLQPTLQAYKSVIDTPEIWLGFYNTIVRVVVGTGLAVFFTALTAYPLSKRDFPFNKQITALILFTMIFNGGLIPSYLLIKSLGIMNSIWALILPGAVTAYNLLIMRSFLENLPSSLEESAKLDGASDFRIWIQIVLPLSKPVLATIALWQAVGNWNAYLDVLIYITDRSKFVLQVILRRILLENETDMYVSSMVSTQTTPTAETVKAAIIMVSTLPIIVVYPYLQKYFVKGIMIGAVKG